MIPYVMVFISQFAILEERTWLDRGFGASSSMTFSKNLACMVSMTVAFTV